MVWTLVGGNITRWFVRQRLPVLLDGGRIGRERSPGAATPAAASSAASSALTASALAAAPRLAAALARTSGLAATTARAPTEA